MKNPLDENVLRCYHRDEILTSLNLINLRISEVINSSDSEKNPLIV